MGFGKKLVHELSKSSTLACMFFLKCGRLDRCLGEAPRGHVGNAKDYGGL